MSSMNLSLCECARIITSKIKIPLQSDAPYDKNHTVSLSFQPFCLQNANAGWAITQQHMESLVQKAFAAVLDGNLMWRIEIPSTG